MQGRENGPCDLAIRAAKIAADGLDKVEVVVALDEGGESRRQGVVPVHCDYKSQAETLAVAPDPPLRVLRRRPLPSRCSSSQSTQALCRSG
jgi:hypothetical protein